MKTIKKLLAFCLAVVMVCACGANAFAAEAISAPTAVEPVSSTLDNARVATFSLEFSLSENQYTYVSLPFSLDGSETLGYSVVWTPAAQYIKIGVRNLSTGNIYDFEVHGGSGSGEWALSNRSVPAGQYQVVVIDPYGYGESYDVSGTANFYWE